MTPAAKLQNRPPPPIVELPRFTDIFPLAADLSREAVVGRRSSSTVEHRFRKAGVKGSNPFFGFGFYPSRKSLNFTLLAAFPEGLLPIRLAFLLKFVRMNQMLWGRA